MTFPYPIRYSLAISKSAIRILSLYKTKPYLLHKNHWLRFSLSFSLSLSQIRQTNLLGFISTSLSHSLQIPDLLCTTSFCRSRSSLYDVVLQIQSTTSMSGNRGSTVYIGNLDERVSDRVLYDILIQAGRVVDLFIPRDKETDKPKGYAFAEFETKEIADYAVRLFTGLVTLYNRTLKFAISGQDKPSSNLPTALIPSSSLPLKQRNHPVPINNMEISQESMRVATSCRVSTNPVDYSQVPVPNRLIHQNNGYGSHFNSNNYEFSRRVFGATLDSLNRSRSRRFDTSNPISYPSH